MEKINYIKFYLCELQTAALAVVAWYIRTNLCNVGMIVSPTKIYSEQICSVD